MTKMPAYAAVAATLTILLTTTVLAANISAVDGGTLQIDGKRLRLWGIEAPAPGDICTTTKGAKWPCGNRGRDQLRAALAEGPASCVDKEPGFVLCRIAGLDIARLMIKEGLAKAGADYHDTEQQARAAKIGIWE
ncbi:hypothetical protein [Tardiphaga sp.]|uniref:thermonuclease family protein n=1 Tax=Tardiphaga sp. TaxID=1926292 RepID=UPI0026123ED2|nr:hypothetical protein [Tardiphaga sp.]MDB5619901.1 micrococcal nuclease-like nuclease [Tardiphaga sp.]